MTSEWELRRKSSLLDLMSFGGFLVIVGLVLVQNPVQASEIGEFFRSFSEYRGPPPYEAFPTPYNALTLFLFLMGMWSLIMAGIKLSAGLSWRYLSGSVLGGLFLILASEILRQYFFGTLTWTVVIAVLFILGGLLAIVGGLAKYAGYGLSQLTKPEKPKKPEKPAKSPVE